MDSISTVTKTTEHSAASVPTSVLPVTIPGIALGRELGHGGMAVVYDGMEEGLGGSHRVAVKLMFPSLSTDAEFRSRFDKEASTVIAFRHENIVRVFRSGESAGTKYIIMEYLAGGTLSEKLKKGPLPLAEAVDVARQLADALAESHAAGVIHRDFKPGNVLFTTAGKPVLCDFGIAKSTYGASAELAQQSVVMGALRYMSPEHAHGGCVTAGSDIYSFGLTLFEMVTGGLPNLPVWAPYDQDIMKRLEPISPDLGRFVCRCLDIDPTLRPSAAECRDWLASARVAAGARSPDSKRRVRLSVGAALFVVAILVIAGIWTAGRRPESEHAAASPRDDGSMRSVSFEPLPAGTRIYIDGELVGGLQASLHDGKHELVAVAAGYYGQTRSIDIAAGQPPVPISIVLEPTRLPTLDEEHRFTKLADSPTLNDSELGTVNDRTWAIALRAKMLHRNGQMPDFNKLIDQVDTLRRYGDSRAAVASLLIDSVQVGHIGRPQVTESLKAASAAGDAMATLFLALAYRDMLDAAGAVALTDPQVRSYCELIKLTMNQGWTDVASEFWTLDHCHV